MPGYFPMYYDAKTGRILLEISRWNSDFLYANSLPAGVGSNDVGLDRGQLGTSMIVRFERFGPKILLVQPNQNYRAVTNDAQERRAVEESFAQSVIWGFTAEAEEGDRVLIDATPFFLRDAHNIPETLSNEKQGSYSLDDKRSAIYPARTKNFPRNTEVEALLTFAGKDSGPWIQSVTPSADSLTVREHHSFVALPETPLTPRVYDPRSGYIAVSYMDYATPISEPVMKRFIIRHRLKNAIPTPPSAIPSSPLFITSIPALPNRFALPCSRARAGGRRPSKRQASAMPSASKCSRPMPTPWTSLQHHRMGTPLHSRLVLWRAVTDPRTGEIIKGQVLLARCACARISYRGRSHRQIRTRPTCRSPHGTDGACPPSPACSPRNWPYPGPRTQLRSQHAQSRLGHGLPAALHQNQRHRRYRFDRCLRHRHRRLGQNRHPLRLFPRTPI